MIINNCSLSCRPGCGAVPTEASRCRAEGFSCPLAPPGHHDQQRLSARSRRKHPGSHSQTVQSTFCTDGAEPPCSRCSSATAHQEEFGGVPGDSHLTSGPPWAEGAEDGSGCGAALGCVHLAQELLSGSPWECWRGLRCCPQRWVLRVPHLARTGNRLIPHPERRAWCANSEQRLFFHPRAVLAGRRAGWSRARGSRAPPGAHGAERPFVRVTRPPRPFCSASPGPAAACVLHGN